MKFIDFLKRMAAAIARVFRRLKPTGGAPTTADGAWIEARFEHQHRRLDYRLFVPRRGAGQPRPLVLMLHGCKQDPSDFATGTAMDRDASEPGCLLVFPKQTQRDNIARCWNWFLPQNQRRERGEAALLAALAQAVAQEHGADPRRIYVAGLSAGGAMAAILGATHGDLFAAVGIHSGLPSGAAQGLGSALSAMKGGASTVGPSVERLPPTIVFHGDADETVNPANGALAVQAVLDSRSVRAEPRETRARAAGGREFTRRIYLAEDGSAMVEHWIVHGSAHAWSGGHPEGSYTDPAGPRASEEMLRFFRSHALEPARVATETPADATLPLSNDI